jgi:hypothetical protein
LRISEEAFHQIQGGPIQPGALGNLCALQGAGADTYWPYLAGDYSTTNPAQALRCGGISLVYRPC